jgi:two-component system sensor histidine kinase AlgZ
MRPVPFDACHGGVLLRTLLFVHVALALGLGLGVPEGDAWLAALSLTVVFTLPATVLWLGLQCWGQRRGWGYAAHWGWALGAGALAGGLAALARQAWIAWLGGAAPDASQAGVAAAAGAGLAACVHQWLEQRRRLARPVADAARLAELQARIRPHFLFNALNSAIALVRVDPSRAEAVLEDLAELFRAATADAAAQVTLADELALASRYLAIEQVRFGERLRLTWSLDPAADGARLPPLVLQPLVENAVRHGVEPAAGGGEVSIDTRCERGRVVIEIRNSVGAGALARPGLGVALANVRERLRLLHDVALQFEAGLDLRGDWIVRIGVPL